MTKTFILLIVCMASASAQPIGFGLKVGAPFTQAFNTGASGSTSYTSDTKRYVVGPQVELRLPAGLGIELDALYTKLNFSSVGGDGQFRSERGNRRHRMGISTTLEIQIGGASAGLAAVRPFVDTGASFRRLTGISQVRNFITGNTQETSSPAELQDKNSTGFVIGGGVEIRALFIRISPEVRFTRWGTSNFREGISNLLETNRNQAQFLVGISF